MNTVKIIQRLSNVSPDSLATSLLKLRIVKHAGDVTFSVSLTMAPFISGVLGVTVVAVAGHFASTLVEGDNQWFVQAVYAVVAITILVLSALLFLAKKTEGNYREVNYEKISNQLKLIDPSDSIAGKDVRGVHMFHIIYGYRWYDSAEKKMGAMDFSKVLQVNLLSVVDGMVQCEKMMETKMCGSYKSMINAMDGKVPSNCVIFEHHLDGGIATGTVRVGYKIGDDAFDFLMLESKKVSGTNARP